MTKLEYKVKQIMHPFPYGEFPDIKCDYEGQTLNDRPHGWGKMKPTVSGHNDFEVCG
jgi:hypothetical protein